MTPEQYRQQQADYSATAEQTVLAVAAASSLSGLSLATALGTFLSTVNDAATRLADAWTSAFLGVSPTGLEIASTDPERLTAAFAIILNDQPLQPLPRIARLARSEPITTARAASQRVMSEHGVKRMRWLLDKDPCPICKAIAERLYPVGELPTSHPNCECTTIPALPLRKRAAA